MRFIFLLVWVRLSDLVIRYRFLYHSEMTLMLSTAFNGTRDLLCLLLRWEYRRAEQRLWAILGDVGDTSLMRLLLLCHLHVK